MNKRQNKYIEQRLKWLNETAKDLKSLLKKTKIEDIEDLHLEINCFVGEIRGYIKHEIVKGGNNGRIRKKNKPVRKTSR